MKDNSKEKEKTLTNKKTTSKQLKRISKSKEPEEIDINIETDSNSKDKSIKKPDDNQEAVFLEKKGENELTDEINNARKKRRRSSASIE